MKIFYLLLVSILFSTLSDAQIKKGAVLLGGNLGQYNNSFEASPDDWRSNSSFINIAIGKAIKDNKVVGLSSGVSLISFKNRYTGLDTNRSRSFTYNIGIFYRQYKKIGKDFYLFGEVETGYRNGYTSLKPNSSVGDVTTRANTGYANFDLGVAYQLFKKMQVELILPNLGFLEYTSTKRISSVPSINEYRNNSFAFNSNLSNSSFLNSIQIGFRFVL